VFDFFQGKSAGWQCRLRGVNPLLSRLPLLGPERVAARSACASEFAHSTARASQGSSGSALFAGIDFEEVLAKRVRPPFVPGEFDRRRCVAKTLAVMRGWRGSYDAGDSTVENGWRESATRSAEWVAVADDCARRCRDAAERNQCLESDRSA
jgi:hypothetical protein